MANPKYRDLTRDYIPTKLGAPHGTVEVRGHPLPTALGLADESNREQHSWWVDVSGDGSHWARFNGHMVHIDVQFRTENRREVNDWKGRDEIRKDGTWTLALNRTPCWEGHLGRDPLAALRDIPSIVERLLAHDAIDWSGADSVADQLRGRKVYYLHAPAVVADLCVLDQGCVMLKPDGVDAFPARVPGTDEDPMERREAKVDLLDPHVWWWRDSGAVDKG